MFGIPIESPILAHQNNVPLIVKLCISVVEDKGIFQCYIGLEFEGVYRKSGPVGQINTIVTGFSTKESLELFFKESSATIDIPTVTSILKKFLRELPTSLIPPRTCAELIKTISIFF
jgi:hypothetical protein